jgi:hypothetical protein
MKAERKLLCFEPLLLIMGGGVSQQIIERKFNLLNSMKYRKIEYKVKLGVANGI